MDKYMTAVQQKAGEFVSRHGLETSAEIRYIDLVSEVGELGKELLKGSDYGTAEYHDTDDLLSETGDVLFSLICLANKLDISLDEALDTVLKKYEKRFAAKGDIGSGR